MQPILYPFTPNKQETPFLHPFQRAEANHRSVNRETIALIERAMKGEADTRPRLSADEILVMARRFADLFVTDPRPADELIGYDANGLPT